MKMSQKYKHGNEECKCRSLAQALAISARQLAEMMGVSVRQIWRLNSSGKLPKPIRLGGSVRWNREEILNWFEAQCPDLETWEAVKGTQKC
ncbi:helix-turn-helix transcriptional regulator [Planctomycetota bacterium]